MYADDLCCRRKERVNKEAVDLKVNLTFCSWIFGLLIVVVPYFESRLTPRINIPLLIGTVYPTPQNITSPLPPGPTSVVSSWGQVR